MRYVVALLFVSTGVMLFGFLERAYLGTVYLLFGSTLVLVVCGVLLIAVGIAVLRDGL